MLIALPPGLLFIVPMFLIAIMLAAFFRWSQSRLSLLVVATLLIVLELVSLYFSGGLIDYQFYVNLNLADIVAGLFIFKLQFALSIIAFIVLVSGQYYLANLARRYIPVVIRGGILGLAILPLCLTTGPLMRGYEIWQVTSAPQQSYTQALADLNLHDYPAPSALISQAGKNIIVISLESFERGLLDDPTIAPQLQALRARYHYFPQLVMAPGSSWTTASMYTYMTGFPLLVGEFDTTPLRQASALKLTTLTDVLKQAGYQMRYLIGSPTFAGIGHIINLLGVEVISEQHYPGEYPAAPFGLYDKDIFAIAKRQVAELSQGSQPFALFISTVSTHAPNGFRDERMRGIVADSDDNMTFVARSLDHSVSDFIGYLEQQGVLTNTVFYLFPDHLMMGAGTPTLARLAHTPRSLYLLTNAHENDLQVTPATTLYQIDLPRLLINGAGIESNARFLTDYLPAGSDKKQYIEQHKSRIATLNRAAEIRISADDNKGSR